MVIAAPRVATPKATNRPKLTAETVVPYLDWVMSNVGIHPAAHTALHMQAAELTIRTLATRAQAKATNATLIEDGTIEPD